MLSFIPKYCGGTLPAAVGLRGPIGYERKVFVLLEDIYPIEEDVLGFRATIPTRKDGRVMASVGGASGRLLARVVIS